MRAEMRVAGQRGWSAEQYEQWTGNHAVEQLLRRSTPAGGRAERGGRSSRRR
jgi:hypothetical protein